MQICPSCMKMMHSEKDHALGDINSKFCNDCTDENGNLKEFEVLVKEFTDLAFEHRKEGAPYELVEKVCRQRVMSVPFWREKLKG